MSKILYKYRRLQTLYKRYGTGKTINYLIKNGPQKKLINRANYLRYRSRYPQNIVFICSLPKSGSTWISKLFASLPGFDLFAPMRWNTEVGEQFASRRWDLYPTMFDEFRGLLAVVKGHTWANDTNILSLNKIGIKYLLTVCDPRDKLISEYWNSRNFPLHWEREIAMSKSVGEYIDYKIESGSFENESVQWIRHWLAQRDPNSSMILRYEDMLDSPYDSFKAAIDFLGFRIDESEIRSVIAKNEFRKVTGRTRGTSDNTQFNRKGVAGEWRTVLTDEQNKNIISLAGDIFTQPNYDTEIS